MFKLEEVVICTAITCMCYYSFMIYHFIISHVKQKYENTTKQRECNHAVTQNSSLIKLKKYAKLIIKDEHIRSKKNTLFDLLSETSKDFLCSLDPTTGKIENFLSNTVNELNLSRGYLYKLDKQKNNFILRHKYDKDYPLFTKKIPVKTNTVLYDTLNLNKPIFNPSNILFLKNSKSSILIPVNVNNVCTGFMGFDTLENKKWDEIEISTIIMLSDFFGAWCLLRRNENIKLNVM